MTEGQITFRSVAPATKTIGYPTCWDHEYQVFRKSELILYMMFLREYDIGEPELVKHFEKVLGGHHSEWTRAGAEERYWVMNQKRKRNIRIPFMKSDNWDCADCLLYAYNNVRIQMLARGYGWMWNEVDYNKNFAKGTLILDPMRYSKPEGPVHRKGLGHYHFRMEQL